MGERQDLRRKVLLRLLSWPPALLPATLGLTATLLSWATDMGQPWLIFGGGVAMLAGVGAWVTRAIFGLDDATRDAMEEIQEETRGAWERRLDELDARLMADQDSRTEDLLRELRDFMQEIRDEGLPEHLNPRSRVEIALQLDELFEECVRALEESLNQWDKAQRVSDPEVRGKLLDGRESQIKEVSECVRVMERLVASEIPALDSSRRDGRLARIREELASSLEVAKRVEKRMHHLEHGLGEVPDAPRAETPK
jgi:hypothetical protein